MAPVSETTHATEQELASLLHVQRTLLTLDGQLLALEKEMQAAIESVPVEWRQSARNLVHYVALRQHDLRELQSELSGLGLSSLGRSEGSVRATLQRVLARVREALALRGVLAAQWVQEPPSNQPRDDASYYLHHHTRDILGPKPADRHVYVMVTAPSAKEADRAWMVQMLRAGMNVLRINCAHESQEQWRAMVCALEQARRDTGIECRILMDLAGPKIRTGTIGEARRIATWKPIRDELGGVRRAARVILRRVGARPPDAMAAPLLIADEKMSEIRRGDQLRFRDVRGKKRSLEVQVVHDDCIECSSNERAYLLDRVAARLYRDGVRVSSVDLEVEGGLGDAIDLRAGDQLLLATSAKAGRRAQRAPDGRIRKRAVVTCTLPAALESLAVGHRVLFDDGRIEAVVEKVKKRRGVFVLRATRTQKETAQLRAEKGINLPDTNIRVPALSADDLRALAFVAEHADAVSISFVKTTDDVRMLHDELERLGKPQLGVVLKIETRTGFDNLPRLLLEGLRRPPLAVMIARGDLAIEVGFERLAELQDEILWLCEACHVPAIWATQVFDTLARTGVPSRAEVTDAAASVAAECVMLNKGPFVAQAVSSLSDILVRMGRHRYKKRNLFPRLHVSTFAER